MDYIVKKLLSLKLFPEVADATLSKQWAKSVVDIQGDVLCVSQFTLHATTRKGSKPDFHNAMGTQQSQAVYSGFLQQMRKAYRADRIHDGQFGATMEVSLTNEGPVTIIVDSHDTRSSYASPSASSTPKQGGNNNAASKQADREAYLQEKLRKREEQERRQRENAARKATLHSQSERDSGAHQD